MEEYATVVADASVVVDEAASSAADTAEDPPPHADNIPLINVPRRKTALEGETIVFIFTPMRWRFHVLKQDALFPHGNMFQGRPFVKKVQQKKTHILHILQIPYLHC